MYETFMNQLFYYCVRLLEIVAPLFGMTYEEINIWLFVVIHPLLTIIFLLLWLKEKKIQKKKIVDNTTLDLIRMPYDEFKEFVNKVIQEEHGVEINLPEDILYLAYKDPKYFSKLFPRHLELLKEEEFNNLKIKKERKTI